MAALGRRLGTARRRQPASPRDRSGASSPCRLPLRRRRRPRRHPRKDAITPGFRRYRRQPPPGPHRLPTGVPWAAYPISGHNKRGPPYHAYIRQRCIRATVSTPRGPHPCKPLRPYRRAVPGGLRHPLLRIACSLRYARDLPLRRCVGDAVRHARAVRRVLRLAHPGAARPGQPAVQQRRRPGRRHVQPVHLLPVEPVQPDRVLLHA